MADPTAPIVEFLTSIGIPVRTGRLRAEAVVPGIALEDGGLALDHAQPFHPGDLLHEAGHLALLPPSRRRTTSGRLTGDVLGYEIGAICWSMAAAVHLDLPLSVVFHDEGYRGHSDWYTDLFAGGTYPGVPLLQWAGLTWEPGKEPEGEEPFPRMRQWLRTTEIEPVEPDHEASGGASSST